MSSANSIDIWVAGSLAVFAAIYIAAQFYPDFQIIPAKKKLAHTEQHAGSDAMVILGIVFFAAIVLAIPLGFLNEIGLPVRWPLVGVACVACWSMLQMMNLFAMHEISERWIRTPLLVLLIVPNLMVALAVPIGLGTQQVEERSLSGAELAAYAFLGLVTTIVHFGFTLVILFPSWASRFTRHVPGIRNHLSHPTSGLGAKASDAPSVEASANLAGSVGRVRTPLRPIGKVVINGTNYQARSEGEFLEAGVEVVVIGAETGELVVRKREAESNVVSDASA